MANDSINTPVKVRLHDEFGRNKLSIGKRGWIDNDDSDTPRKGIIYKDREYVVDESDHVVKHFLEGGDLVRVNGDGERVEVSSLEEELEELPGIGEARAESIAQDFSSFEEFAEEVDAEYLSEAGLGASQVDEVLNTV